MIVTAILQKSNKSILTICSFCAIKITEKHARKVSIGGSQLFRKSLHPIIKLHAISHLRTLCKYYCMVWLRLCSNYIFVVNCATSSCCTSFFLNAWARLTFDFQIFFCSQTTFKLYFFLNLNNEKNYSVKSVTRQTFYFTCYVMNEWAGWCM